MDINMSTWVWSDWLSNLGFVLLLASYLTSDIVRLRQLALVGLGVLAVATYGGGLHPLWLTGVWLVVLLTVNVARILLKSSANALADLTIEEEALRSWLFPTMTRPDFVKLLRAGTRSTIGSGTFLATQGEKIDELHFITQGAAHVIANGMVVATLREGSLVGEVSFFRDDMATASVVAQGDIKVLSFGRNQLRKLMHEHEALQRAMHESIGRDLGFKLTTFDESRF